MGIFLATDPVSAAPARERRPAEAATGSPSGPAAIKPIPASGGEGAPAVFHPLRADRPPQIDGRLDDDAWRAASPVTGFKTFIPDFGREPGQTTTAYMAYDAENLYFAFKCYDREPDKIKASVAARDTIRADDFICINLDTFNDQQSLYAFYVNPFGIQTDSRFASGKEDFSVDFVWYSAGRIDPDGYTVELRIPFKSIRYAGRSRVEMSIFFERRISRISEHSSYPPLDPQRGYFFLTQMMPLELRDIRQYTLLELLPGYTHSLKYEQAEGRLTSLNPAHYSFHELFDTDLSLTGKYGVTSQLILDATWNPDFSQIEADAGQVDANLRYDLFYPEKRPFFLEGAEMFLLAGSIDGDPLQTVVHTRTIIDPRVGFKLSGKLGRKDSLASIVALDEAPSLDPLYTGGDRHAGAGILRYKHALAGDGFIGGFATGREYGGGASELAGLDGQLRLGPSSMFSWHGFGSWTKPEPPPPAVTGGGTTIEAPAAGATGTETPARMSGVAVGLDYYYDTRNLGISLGFQDISRDFEARMGYLTRTGLARFRGAVLPRLYPASRFFRKLTLQFSGSLLKDLWSGLYETSDAATLQVLLPGNTTVGVAGIYANEIFLGRRFDTSGWLATASSQVTKQLSLRGQFRRGRAIRYVVDPYQGYGSQAAATVTYLPSEQFNLSLSWTYADLYRQATAEKVFDYTILRARLTYQVNRYLFFRAIVEDNSYYRRLLTDFLASFTYIPGTVIQLGYGSLYEKLEYVEGEYRPAARFLEMKRGLFFKASYLWRF